VCENRHELLRHLVAVPRMKRCTSITTSTRLQPSPSVKYFLPDYRDAANRSKKDPRCKSRRSTQDIIRRRDRDPPLRRRRLLRRRFSRAALYTFLQTAPGTCHGGRLGLDMESTRPDPAAAELAQSGYAVRIEQEHGIGRACKRSVEKWSDRRRDQRGAIAGWNLCRTPSL
jgi:hypothetical protein